MFKNSTMDADDSKRLDFKNPDTSTFLAQSHSFPHLIPYRVQILILYFINISGSTEHTYFLHFKVKLCSHKVGYKAFRSYRMVAHFSKKRSPSYDWRLNTPKTGPRLIEQKGKDTSSLQRHFC